MTSEVAPRKSSSADVSVRVARAIEALGDLDDDALIQLREALGDLLRVPGSIGADEINRVMAIVGV